MQGNQQEVHEGKGKTADVLPSWMERSSILSCGWINKLRLLTVPVIDKKVYWTDRSDSHRQKRSEPSNDLRGGYDGHIPYIAHRPPIRHNGDAVRWWQASVWISPTRIWRLVFFCGLVSYLCQGVKVRLSVQKTKGFWVFPNESTFCEAFLFYNFSTFIMKLLRLSIKKEWILLLCSRFLVTLASSNLQCTRHKKRMNSFCSALVF